MEIKRVGSQPPTKTIRLVHRHGTDQSIFSPRAGARTRCELTLSRGREPHGTRIPLGKLRSLRLGTAGRSARVDPSRKYDPEMWSGFHPTRSAGMGPRRPRP